MTDERLEQMLGNMDKSNINPSATLQAKTRGRMQNAYLTNKRTQGGRRMFRILRPAGVLTLVAILMMVGLFSSLGILHWTTPLTGLPAGELSLGVVIQPDSGELVLNPMVSVDSASASIENNIFQGLIRYDESLKLVGQLAKEWNFDPETLELTFYLREDVNWHDGEPFTAKDVEFSFNLWHFDPDVPIKWSGPRPIADIKVVDTHTITFIIHEGMPFWAVWGSMSLKIIPRHIFDPQVAENPVAIRDMAFNHPANLKPIGTGPFVFGEMVEDEYVLLHRNEEYYEDLPDIKTLKFKIYPSIDVAIEGLKDGDIDVWPDLNNEQKPILEAALSESHTFHSAQDLSYFYLGFNFMDDAFGSDKDNPFQDLRVRQAIAHALDREQMLNDVLEGHGTLMNSHIPAFSWAYSPTSQVFYHYDLEKAQNLLEETGWTMGEDGWRYKDGQRLGFELSTTGSPRDEIALAVKEALIPLGIDVELNIVDWSELLSNHLYPGTYQMVALTQNVITNLDSYLVFHSSEAGKGINFGAYSNPRLDNLLEKSRKATDFGVLGEIYAQQQYEISKDLPFIFLFSRNSMTVADKGIGNIKGPSFTWQIENWTINE